MATYSYKARDKFGKLVQGKMGADSESAVAAKLNQMNFVPITISKPSVDWNVNKFFDRFQKKIKFSELNMFTHQLYTLQNAGLPLITSLGSLKEQTTNEHLKDVIAQMIRDLEGGSTFSDALERHPKIFNQLYVSMVKSGEISGRLPEILLRLAVLGEKEEDFRLRLTGAMRYPTIVVAALVIAFISLITFVVPRFTKLYGKFGVELPLPTRILIWINYVIVNYYWLIIGGIIGIVFLFRKLINTQKGRLWWDGFKLKIIIFGPLMFKLLISRFCRITGLLIRSGLPILQVLELVSESTANAVIARTINNIKASVKEGNGMSEAMKNSGIFPPIVTQMVSVGEDTGDIDALLMHVAEYYDRLVDHTVKNLVTLIEPILIFVLGISVLFMALGIFLPIWKMMSLYKH